MVFAPRKRANIVSTSFPQFTLASSNLKYVYLFQIFASHSLMTTMSYVRYEICLLGLIFFCRKFSKCSVNVKIQLFKSYCLCLYGTALITDQSN